MKNNPLIAALNGLAEGDIKEFGIKKIGEKQVYILRGFKNFIQLCLSCHIESVYTRKDGLIVIRVSDNFVILNGELK